MSADVADEEFLLQKKIEARIHERHPDKWMPLYSQVTHLVISHIQKHIRKEKKQDKIMKEILQDPKSMRNGILLKLRIKYFL